MTHMENNTKKQRSPSEIIAETEARLAKLRERQAKVESKNHPEILALMRDRDAHMKELREARKILGKGPQSAQARIEKHESWIGHIRNEAREAEVVVHNMELLIDEIDDQISTLTVAHLPEENSAQA